MKLRNRPENYVKRSDLTGRPSYALKEKDAIEKKPKERDFSTVEIDAGFYFSFPSEASKGS